MESRGIFLMTFRNPAYGFMAYQIAMSIKHYSPHIPIYLLTDEIAVSKLRTLEFFDTVEYMETPADPALCKIMMYDKLPFDHNIFLDVDGLCLSEMDSLFDEFIADERAFRCFVYAYYDQHSDPVLPLMVWADRDVIWDHYQLNGETLPATQSSMLYIRKGDFCKSLYQKMQSNYANRIPLEKLRNKWGGGQPDELYLNVTLAQMGYDPQTTNTIWFADNTSLKPHQLKHQYKILSLFGTANNVKKEFERFYDDQVKTLARLAGVRVSYEWKAIKSKKHANQRNVKSKAQAFKGGFVRSEKLALQPPVQKKGRTLLFTSYFETPEARKRELKTCLENNIRNKDIDHIFISSEVDVMMENPKVTVRIAPRPTYQNLIDWANSVSRSDDIVIIANSDIYFDDTINWPHRVHMARTMIALSRWDIHPGGLKKLFAYEHSQDTWIFKGQISLKDINYFMGIPGCDNRIAYDADKQGYRVVNTAKDIITHHLHNSNIRSHDETHRIEGEYMPVYISSIRDIMSNKLLMIQPGKVGDVLLCLPIAKYFSDQGHEVYWQCPLQYHHLFKYVDYVTPVATANEKDYTKVVDLSFGINQHSKVHHWWTRNRHTFPSFVHAKYHLAGVDVTERHNLNYNRNGEREDSLFNHLGLNDGSDYVLTHTCSDYGSPIEVTTSKRVVEFKPVEGYSIFDWRKVIESASEIHCIDSSLVNFTDVCDTSGELFYYITNRVPLQSDRTYLQKNWTVINCLEYANS